MTILLWSFAPPWSCWPAPTGPRARPRRSVILKVYEGLESHRPGPGLDIPAADSTRSPAAGRHSKTAFRPLAEHLIADEPALPFDAEGGCRVTIREAAAALRAAGFVGRTGDRRAGAHPSGTTQAERLHHGHRRTGARAGAPRRTPNCAAGHDRGPLHGIPVALKDLFLTTRSADDRRARRSTRISCPRSTPPWWRSWPAAGAVMMGKLNMHELAYGITSANPHFGPVRNPWNPEHIPADRAAARAPRSRREWSLPRWAAIPAARFAFRRRFAGPSGSSRPTAA